MTDTAPRRRTSLGAALSLAFGLAAPCTFGATALPALFLGYVAMRKINLSDGRLRGYRAAAAGMALGAAGVAAFVVGLVVVSLTKVRANSAEMVCRDNLRRLGLAASVFHDDRGHFPPGTVIVDGLSPERRLSWQASILPFMDPGQGQRRADVFARLDLGKAWDVEPNQEVARTRMPEFLCPGQMPEKRAGEPAPTAYLGIAGIGADAAGLPTDHERAGFFGYDRVLTRKGVTRGQGETLLAVESATGWGPWAAGGPATVRAVVSEDQPYLGRGRPFGGLHPGGAMSLFVDGHVQFVREGVSPRVWEAHATIHAEP